MGSKEASSRSNLCFLLLFSLGFKCLASETEASQTATLKVDASPQLARKIPETLFGIFFEEINHAGAGGIWAELVNNRGFEAGGPHTPSNIDPWSIIGDDSSVFVATDRTSCFSRNVVALRMEVLCNDCPAGGVGIYNPGFWGMAFLDHKREIGVDCNTLLFPEIPCDEGNHSAADGITDNSGEDCIRHGKARSSSSQEKSMEMEMSSAWSMVTVFSVVASGC